MRWLRRRPILAVIVCVSILAGAGLLYLARPAGGELERTGHDSPTRHLQARGVLVWARLFLRSDHRFDGTHIAGVIPLYRALPKPTSQAGVFAATAARGDDYLVSFARGENLSDAAYWRADALGFDECGGLFEYSIGVAERSLSADLGRQPDAIRYVDSGYGFWVVARAGKRERGVFLAHQGFYDCWPQFDRIYSGRAILRHLQHMEDAHGSGSDACYMSPDEWE